MNGTFPSEQLRNLMAATSDHSPIIIATENNFYVLRKLDELRGMNNTEAAVISC